MRETTPCVAESVLREKEREGTLCVSQIVCLWLDKGVQLRNVLGAEKRTRRLSVVP